MTARRWSVALAVTLSLVGCGSGLSGTYSDPEGMVSYTFDGDEVTGSISAGGPPLIQTGKFAVEGSKITLTFTEPLPQTIPLTIRDDGVLIHPMGVEFTKE